MSVEHSVLLPDAPLDLRFGQDELDDVRTTITTFIAEMVDAAGAEGAVLGLSGGIDSTTTAHLAVEALGAEGLHGLVMPSAVNDPDNMADAEEIAQGLGISYDVVEIEPIAERIVGAIGEGNDDQTAHGNVYVRTRAVLNYLVANRQQRIVLGTGNRSEALVGYYTKYGDQAVDCNPIGPLYKQQVRQLAASIGVPMELVMKTPSAGMWVGQTDEGELGMSYDTLDAILALHVDGPLSVSMTAALIGVDAADVEAVDALVSASAHKRSMPPAPQL
jgi:NH(3)-dependent NAD(+) synthetase (EC 6.3.1.5)